eukprot:1978099-Pyramimonas_sp.AAC.1
MEDSAVVAQLTAVIQNTVKGLQTQLEARFMSVETNVNTLTQHMGNAEAHITAISNQMTEVMKKQARQDEELRQLRARP